MAYPRFTSSTTPGSRQATDVPGPSAPVLTLPPPLTSEARLSLTRLPIEANCTLHWWHFTTRTLGAQDNTSPSDLHAIELAIDVLAVEAQRSAEEQAAHPYELATCLSRSPLWIAKRKRVRTSNAAEVESESLPHQQGLSLWLFQLRPMQTRNAAPVAKEDLGGPSSIIAAAPLTTSGKVCDDLKRAGVPHTQGYCKLSEIYAKGWETSTDCVSSLLPQPGKRSMLRAFSRAVEDHFLLKWVFARESEGCAPLHVDQTGQVAHSKFVRTIPRTASTDVKSAVADTDDDEEGALESKYPKPSVIRATEDDDRIARLWPRTPQARQRPIVRFGRGVIMFDTPSASHSLLASLAPSVPLHMALRCCIDDQGNIFLQTWPRKLSASRLVSRSDVEGRAVLVAPLGTKVTLVRHLGASHQEMNENDVFQGECSQEGLWSLLRVLGVATSFLDEEWILCRHKDGQQFIWPAQLCLLYSPVRIQASARRPLLIDSTLDDVAAKARVLVRESLGLPPMVEGLEVARDVSEEQMEIASDAQDSDEQDDPDDLEAEDLTMTGVGHEEHQHPPAMQLPSVVELHTSSSRLNVESAAAPPAIAGTISRRNSSQAGDTAQATQRDEEMDLWGPFGFGEQTDVNSQPLPRSRDSLDDGGFGLVTEDDFSFFDDAAAAFGTAFPDVGDEQMEETNTERAQHDTAEEKGNVESESPAVDQHQHPSHGHNFAEQQVQQHRVYDIDSSGSASTIDPSSLPGFTPGSLSASSPAVGGMNAKTPRTPYSPGQDMADSTITIQGEHDDGAYGPVSHFYATGQANNGIAPLHASMAPPPPGVRPLTAKERPMWSVRTRRDITSKYEQGKFALPNQPSARKRNSEEEAVEQEQMKPILPRSRLGQSRIASHATTPGRRLSATKHFGAHAATGGHKSRLGILRADDEMSEATFDGTISERSSLMDEDSGDNESMSSDGADDEEAIATNESQAYIEESLALLRQAMVPDDPIVIAKRAEDADATLTPMEWSGVVGLLIDNPALRTHAAKLAQKPVRMGTMSRSDCQHLFLPMRGRDQLASLEEVLAIPSAPHVHPTTSGPSTELKRSKVVVGLLEPPSILVGCQSSVVSVAPSALAFWDKLGLSAVSGPKHVVAFAMHVGDVDEPMQRDIMDWFAGVGKVFAQCGLGSHTVAEQGLLALDAIRTKNISQLLSIIAADAERWSDTLDSLLSRFAEPLRQGKFVVLYAIGLPHHGRSLLWSLARLEHDLQHLALSRLKVASEMIVVRPGPWEYVSAAHAMSRMPRYDVRRAAGLVYDSLQVPVGATYNNEAHLPRFADTPIAVRYPLFSILPAGAREGGSIASQFALDGRTKLLNVLEHGALLHFGYRMAEEAGGVSLVSVMDERAQGYTATAWRRTSSVANEIRQMWAFVVRYTMRARTRWRVVVCKDGTMAEEEAEAWSAILEKQGFMDAYALDVTLVCATDAHALAIVLPTDNTTTGDVSRLVAVSELPQSSKTSAQYIDACRAKYAIYPQYRMTLMTRNDESSVDEEDDIPLLALRSALLVTVPSCWNGAQPVQYEGDRAIDEEQARNVEGQTKRSSCKSVWPADVPHQLWVHILQVYSDDARSGGAAAAASAGSLATRMKRITNSFQELELVARERALLCEDECTLHLPWHLAILRSLVNTTPTAFQQPTQF